MGDSSLMSEARLARPYYLTLADSDRNSPKGEVHSFFVHVGLIAPLIMGVAGAMADVANLVNYIQLGDSLVWGMWLACLLAGEVFGMTIFCLFLLMNISDQNPALKQWLTRNGRNLGPIAVIVALHFTMSDALVSGAFGSQLLSCPLSTEAVSQLRILWIPAVIVDNLPRLLVLVVIHEHSEFTTWSLISFVFAALDILAMLCGGLIHLIINRRRRRFSFSPRFVAIAILCLCCSCAFLAAEVFGVLYVTDRISSRCGSPYVGRNVSTATTGVVDANDRVFYRCDPGCTTTGKPGGPKNTTVTCVAHDRNPQYNNKTEISCNVVDCGHPPKGNHTVMRNLTRAYEHVMTTSEPVLYDCSEGGYTTTGHPNDYTTFTLRCSDDGFDVQPECSQPGCMQPECKPVSFYDRQYNIEKTNQGVGLDFLNDVTLAYAKQHCVKDPACQGFVYDNNKNYYMKGKGLNVEGATPDVSWYFSIIRERYQGTLPPELLQEPVDI
jgi:hypothetical protein